VTQLEVVGQGAKQRDPVSNEHWNSGNGEELNQACAQKALNRNAAVNIEMMGAAGLPGAQAMGTSPAPASISCSNSD